jgi:DNA-binding transcriptional MocR family regulator
VNLAREHNVPILEDCALETTAFSGSTPRPLAYFDPENVVSIGSLNLVFWPGIHVGWIRASRSIAARLSRLKLLHDLGTSVPSQVLALRVLDSIDQIASFRQRQLNDRCELFCRLLTEQLPEWEFKKPSGGLCLWVRLPFGDATSFAQFAARAGVRVLSGNSMTVDGSHSEYLRLPITACPATIEAGVVRLASAWRRYEHARSNF